MIMATGKQRDDQIPESCPKTRLDVAAVWIPWEEVKVTPEAPLESSLIPAVLQNYRSGGI